ISAGSWEDWRSDADAFPETVKGKELDGWPGERWLDIRRLDVLLPIMDERMAACRAKGFDAVDPDNMDGYTQDSGFTITAADQLTYNKAIARLAHRYGMGVGLKNDPEQVADLVPHFDFAVVEQCVVYGECAAWTPFITDGKAVLHVEYDGRMSEICAATKPLGFSTIKKHLNLDAYRRVC
ncbi:MAG TPA: endo alpha-1,4 polygalactosaminidase, partial [Dermatophilaceae bacterium]|nr:endo alpha-1,4 polygalactosaminidase [Dermatophilaceae bacterium]